MHGVQNVDIYIVEGNLGLAGVGVSDISYRLRG